MEWEFIHSIVYSIHEELFEVMRYQMYTREKPLQRLWSGSKAIFLTLINFLLSSSHLREYFSPWKDLKPQPWLLTSGGPGPRPRWQNLPILRQVTNLPRDTARKPTIDHWRFWHLHVLGMKNLVKREKRKHAINFSIYFLLFSSSLYLYFGKSYGSKILKTSSMINTLHTGMPNI